MTAKNNQLIQPDEGDIVLFGPAFKDGERRPVINLEPYKLHKNKDSFNGILVTTQRVDSIYPLDYPLFDNQYLSKPSKAICDQPTRIFKDTVTQKIGKVTEEDLEEIRKRTAESLGIQTSYTDSTN